MDTQAERLIGLATHPLADNAELHLAAAGELQRRIEENAASPEDLKDAADALEQADLHPLRRRWQAALSIVTLLVSFTMLFLSARQLSGFVSIWKSFPLGFSGMSAEDTIENLPRDQRMLLYGDTNTVDRAERWKPLWKSDPHNPVFLAQYASGYSYEKKELSSEITEAAAKIDPDNGWYAALVAGSETEKLVTKRKQTLQEKRDFKTPVYDIVDAEKLSEVLSQIHQAAVKPRLTAHEEELYRMRLPLLPKRHDFVSQAPAMAYLASQVSKSLPLREIMDVLAAGAQECAVKHDVAGFQQIIGDWEALSRNWTESGVSLVDLLIARVLFIGPVENFRDTALALGLDREAARFSKLLEFKKADKARRDSKRSGATGVDLVRFRGSVFAWLLLPMTARQVEHPPQLSDADLRPSRYAEHALFLRAASLASWVLLGVAAGLASFHRLIRSPLAHRMSLRWFEVIRARDWAIIAAGGVLAPLLWYLAVVHLTPLSSREWSFNEGGIMQAACQYGSMLALMLVLTAVMCSSRLAIRGALIGLTSPAPWLGWLAAISAALAIPVIGSVMPAAHSHSPLEWFTPFLLWTGRVLLAVPVLWLLAGVCRSIMGAPAHALRRSVIARMLLPAWIFGMLVMAVILPVFHAQESHWIQQDTLFEINAEKPAMSRYEWEVTQQLRKELLEMMR